MTEDERAIVDEARAYTMVSPERLVANIDAVSHVIANDVPGAIVECGVWRGGSILSMIRTLQRAGVTDRDVYLFDTFEGMSEPSEHDTSRFDEPALRTWRAAQKDDEKPWAALFRSEVFDLDNLRSLMSGTGYPADRIHFIQGRVEDTLPASAPDVLAVLRLDTDWYESTKHELVHLYPLLSKDGVLIVDDFGHWDGSRRAVEEFFGAGAASIFLARIDYTGRIGIKTQ